jgi:murein DD-endopeptidase MepM/ murein hydrolase activator NlpD
MGLLVMIITAVAIGCGDETLEQDFSNHEDHVNHEEMISLEQEVTLSRLNTMLFGREATLSGSYAPNGRHAGIDLAGVNGYAVRSTVNGTIARNESWCGIVSVNDGSKNHFFLHMNNRTSKRPGESVRVGDVLGYVSEVDGDTPGSSSDTNGDGCRATGPHLHYEIRPNTRSSPANPTSDNTNTTSNPLSFSFTWENDFTGPSISISSPSSGSSLTRGSTYTIRWSASDPAALGDATVDLIADSNNNCVGAPRLISIRSSSNYASSVSWRVPSTQTTGYYKIKVAARDLLGNWSCSMTRVRIQ